LTHIQLSNGFDISTRTKWERRIGWEKGARESSNDEKRTSMDREGRGGIIFARRAPAR